MGGLASAQPRSGGSVGAWWEIVRPFSLPATLVPALVGAAAAWSQHLHRLGLLPLCLGGVVLLQAGTNIVNEVYDVRSGVDTLQTPRASRVLVEGRLHAHRAQGVGMALLGLGVVVGALISWIGRLGPVPLALGLLGGAVGWAYTAPPLACKYRGWGLPLEALVLGPLVVLGSAFVQAARLPAVAVASAVPLTALVASILIGNDLRDAFSDRQAGIRTLPSVIGWHRTRALFVACLLGGFGLLLGEGLAGLLPTTALLGMAGLPLALRAVGVLRGVGEQQAQTALARLDQLAAQAFAAAGVLMALGLVVAGVGV